MNFTYTAVIHREEHLYAAECPEVGTASQGESLDEAVANLREATRLYLEEFPKAVGERAFLTTFDVPAHAAIDANFINDRYWLLFPFHLLWDKATLDVATEPEALPVGDGMGRRPTVTYPSDGGYTPGDAYDLYLDTDGAVLAWVFRKGNQAEPSRMAAWTEIQEIEGLRISVNRPGPDPDTFRVWFSDLRVE